MKGQVHTGEFSRTLFSSEFGLLEPGRLVSHLALCDAPAYHKVLFLTDCAINIRPEYEEKVKILDNAIEMALRLGVCDPKVGLVAPVETVKEKIESTVHAARLKKEYCTFPEAILDGPFGLDVALSAEAARIKKIESRVAGDVDILLFPELTAGNAVYKALTILGGATIAGVLLGLKNPVVVTSRSDDEQTKLLSLKLGIALAAEMGVCG
jgi:phosphotransacetylase